MEEKLEHDEIEAKVAEQKQVEAKTEEDHETREAPPQAKSSSSSPRPSSSSVSLPITIVFKIKPDGYPLQLQFPRSATLAEVRATVASDLHVEVDSLQFSSASLDFSMKAPDSLQQRLQDFSCQADRHYVVDVVQRDSAAASGYEFTLPDTLDVLVESDDPTVPAKALKVHISRDTARMQPKYLGGFRHKVNGKVLLNAETQVVKPRDFAKEQQRADSLFHRDTQTTQEVSRSAQTLRESGTQMPRPGLHISTENDWEITAQPYFDSAQHHLRKVKQTVVIQTYWRAYCARRRAKEVRLQRDRKVAEVARMEEEERLRKEERNKKEVERRMQPRTRADFEVLYNEVEHWRRHESERIERSVDNMEERQKELERLLEKETKLLQTIQKLKMETNAKYKKIKISKMLREMAAPKRWELRDGDIAEVHTPYTIRAKALQEIYEVRFFWSSPSGTW